MIMGACDWNNEGGMYVIKQLGKVVESWKWEWELTARMFSGCMCVQATAWGIFGGVNACVCGDVKQRMFGE